jgi:sporulation protein YlmC with PRC-barrel domain
MFFPVPLLAGKYKNVEELRNLIVLSRNGTRLGEIADVQDKKLRRKWLV